MTFEHFVPWFAVQQVEAADTDQPMVVVKAYPSDGTRLRKHFGRGGYESQFLPFIAVRALWLRGNSAAAYQALNYYFQHADQRSRLGTP